MLPERVRVYLLVVAVCGVSAALMQLFLSGTGRPRNYAEARLEGVRDAAPSAAADPGPPVR